MKRLLMMMLVLSTITAQANETVWKRDYWAWGRGTNTNAASTAAFNNAKPAIAELRKECDDSKGIVSTSSSYGLCTKDEDPMFCKYGCYACPIYGTASCVIETSGALKPGALVETLNDADLFVGNQKVGSVKKGEKFHIDRIQNGWAALDLLDGTSVTGWIQLKHLKVTTRD